MHKSIKERYIHAFPILKYTKASSAKDASKMKITPSGELEIFKTLDIET